MEHASQSANGYGFANLFLRRNINAQTAENYLKLGRHFNGKRWRLPRRKPRITTLADAKDDRLRRWFNDVINDIIDYYGFSANRKAVAPVESDANLTDERSGDPPCPDLVLLGQDDKQLPRPIGTYSATMGMSKEGIKNLYRGCVAFGNLERFGTQESADSVLKDMSTYARECFIYQPSRRFVYGFSVSRETFQLFFFDRTGAVQSSRVDIHQGAKVLVGVVRLLSDPDLSILGFDPDIFWEKNERYVKVNYRAQEGLKVKKFKIEHVLYRTSDVYGRGTVCWIVCDPKSGYRVVMKDSWRDKNSREEVGILTDFSGKHLEIGRRKVVFVDESFVKYPLSTASIRADQGVIDIGPNNRFFSRIAMELLPSIRHFQSSLHLLQGFRDAVQAHYHLVKAGILHRYICPDNILLRKSDGGPRSVLVGFRNAVYCIDGQSPDTMAAPKEKSPFRSVTNIKAESSLCDAFRHKHNFVDDLEAFYWSLLWLFMVHDGPSTDGALPDEKRCHFTEQWKTKDSFSLFLTKTLYMRNSAGSSSARVAPYFTRRPYLRLLDNLRGFLNKYNGLRDSVVLARSGQVEEPDLFPQLEEIYAKYLSYLDDAILQLVGNTNFEPSEDSINILDAFKDLEPDTPKPGPAFAGTAADPPRAHKPKASQGTQPVLLERPHFTSRSRREPKRRAPIAKQVKGRTDVQVENDENDENDDGELPIAKRACRARDKVDSDVYAVETRRSERLRAVQAVTDAKAEVPAFQAPRMADGGTLKRKARK